MIQPDPILQSRLIEPPWSFRNGDRLPGTSPVGGDDWLFVDDAYAQQMALRERLFDQRLDAVYAMKEDCYDAASEILTMALALLATFEGFDVGAGEVTRPDGRAITLDTERPLLTLGRLVQQDICLLQKHGDEHVLTGAVLCFPASWMLAEKFGHPMIRIHAPVDSYDAGIAMRVQRLFDAIQPGRPIRRANCLPYADFALFQPRSEIGRRVKPAGQVADYIRAERQCLLRLPESQAVAFTIHTSVVRRTDMTPQDAADYEAFIAENDAEVVY